MSNSDTDARQYMVVRNAEEQYSIWLGHRDLPAGWFGTGTSGSRADCLDHIELVWTDMRPKSARTD